MIKKYISIREKTIVQSPEKKFKITTNEDQFKNSADKTKFLVKFAEFITSYCKINHIDLVANEVRLLQGKEAKILMTYDDTATDFIKMLSNTTIVSNGIFVQSSNESFIKKLKLASDNIASEEFMSNIKDIYFVEDLTIVFTTRNM